MNGKRHVERSDSEVETSLYCDYLRCIMTNHYNTVLYIAVTNNLERRIWEHKSLLVPWFTKKYNITKLIYFEESQSRNDAIAGEKQLKGWSRIKKLSLVQNMNTDFTELFF